MKRLIKRYVLKAQVDKENDEVNEGNKLYFFTFQREFLSHLLEIGITVVHGAFS